MHSQIMTRESFKKLPKSHYKKCPKCRSFFITESECESCGFQFKKKLESVFSHRSFYALKDDYNREMEIFYRFLPKLISKNHPIRKKYVILYLNRSKKLIQYFSHSDHSPERLRLFLSEFEALCEEAFQLKVTTENFFEIIEKCENDILRQKLFEITSVTQAKFYNSGTFSFLNKRLLGTFRYSYLLKLLFFVILLNWVAIEVFKQNY